MCARRPALRAGAAVWRDEQSTQARKQASPLVVTISLSFTTQRCSSRASSWISRTAVIGNCANAAPAPHQPPRLAGGGGDGEWERCSGR